MMEAEAEAKQQQLVFLAFLEETEGGALNPATAAGYRKSFNDNLKLKNVLKLKFFSGPLLEIEVNDYGMHWGGYGLSSSTFSGIFPAGIDRTLSQTKEANRCLYLALGLSMEFSPYLLQVAFRNAANRVTQEKPVWRDLVYANSEEHTWENYERVSKARSRQSRGNGGRCPQ
jgi:hypothetical protein